MSDFGWENDQRAAQRLALILAIIALGIFNFVCLWTAHLVERPVHATKIVAIKCEAAR